MKALISKEVLEEEYTARQKTIKQIAIERGLSAGTIYNYLKRYNIETRKGWTEAQRAKILASKIGKPSPRKGQKLSKETKRKISEGRRGHFKRQSKYGGHTKKRDDGYIKVYCPSNPGATKDGYMMEHILVMEEHIGRALKEDEVVHHINHIRDDNRIENLQLMTFKEHAALHMRERWKKKKEDIKQCSIM